MVRSGQHEVDQCCGHHSMNELGLFAGGEIEVPLDNKEVRLNARDQIDRYEQAIKDEAGSERGIADVINDNGLKEYFVGGAYTRQLFIPKGVTIVSKLWNKERLWIIAYGDVSIMTETGIKRVQGAHVEIPPLGSKTALYTHEDTLWFAITGAEATNSDDVENEVIAKGYSELEYPWKGE